MTEVIGDVVMPKELILPVQTSNNSKTGQIKLSGSKIWFYSGSAWEVVTSA